MNLVKPIFVVGIPSKYNSILQEVEKSITESLKNEYHIFVYVNDELYDFKFQAFYAKDLDEVKYEELKRIFENLKNK